MIFLIKGYSGCCEDYAVSERKKRISQGLAYYCAERVVFTLICQWGERVQWDRGREGFLWAILIRKVSVILAVQSEKKKKKNLIETSKILRLIPLLHRSTCYSAEYSCIFDHFLFLQNSSEEQSEEFLWATRPGSLHFLTSHANARCH